jgi:tetratricopeptide (TPR) repeat protein
MVLGDFYLRNSLVAAAKNDGGNTYNLQIKAIANNPFSAEYRRIYSQTNLALAETMLSNKEITDDDKEKASVLIQQSVREAKAAIALNQADPDKWLNLAAIYKSLIGVVDGAADWSYQAYSQAVALNPTDPTSGLDLGGLLYAAGQYEEADRMFEQVVTNKNDYANGWYNWAYSAKKLNKLANAVDRLSQALTLVPATSGDYEQASTELATWKKEYDEAVKKYNEQVKAAEEEAKKAETLTTPEPLPTGNVESQIPIPSGGDIQPPVVNQENQTPLPTSEIQQPTVSPTSPAVE